MSVRKLIGSLIVFSLILIAAAGCASPQAPASTPAPAQSPTAAATGGKAVIAPAAKVKAGYLTPALVSVGSYETKHYAGFKSMVE